MANTTVQVYKIPNKNLTKTYYMHDLSANIDFVGQ